MSYMYDTCKDIPPELCTAKLLWQSWNKTERQATAACFPYHRLPSRCVPVAVMSAPFYLNLGSGDWADYRYAHWRVVVGGVRVLDGSCGSGTHWRFAIGGWLDRLSTLDLLYGLDVPQPLGEPVNFVTHPVMIPNTAV